MKKKSEVYGVLDTQKEMDKAKGRQVVVYLYISTVYACICILARKGRGEILI